MHEDMLVGMLEYQEYEVQCMCVPSAAVAAVAMGGNGR